MPDEAARKDMEAYVASILPDVCKSPSAPVPYPILATLDKSIRTARKVRMTGQEAFHAMSRVAVVQGDEAGVGGGLISQKNIGYCKPIKWSSHVRTEGNWLVMHTVDMEMNCLMPDSTGNTLGKLFYVKCMSAAAVTPEGKITIAKNEEFGGDGEGGGNSDGGGSGDSGSGDGGQGGDNGSDGGDSDGGGDGDSGGGDGGGGNGSGGGDDPPDGPSKDSSGQQDSGLSPEEQAELDDLKRQEAETQQQIDELKDLAIEAAKALDPTPASDLYDMVKALQAGDIAAALVAAAFVLISLSPWKLIKMGRGAFKLAKIMKKLKKLMDKLKKIKKRMEEIAKKAAERAKRRAIRIFKRVVNISDKQLQKKFKHAKDFGVEGNYSKANADKFKKSIEDHVANPNTKVVNGTYKGQPATIYTDPNSGLAVITKPNGDFVSGWKLSPDQLGHVMSHGNLS